MTFVNFDPAHPDMAQIKTNSKLFSSLLKNSLSRKWVASMQSWYYPIQELADLFSMLHMCQEPFKLDSRTTEEWQYFQQKLGLLREIKDNKKENYTLPELPNFTGELRDYQKSVVAQILLMHKQLLALSVGMGKTIISLYTILTLRKVCGAKALIICESNQIHKPWISQIMEFSKGVYPLIVDGNAEERQNKIQLGKSNPEKHWLWIMSYDVARIEIKNIPRTWDILVMDEITKIKNVSSQASEAIQSIKSDYVVGLSATPITNTYYDLYGIFKIINPYVFTTKLNFTERFLELDFFQRPKGLKKGMETELNNKVYPWMVQLVKEDYGLAKPVHISTFPVPLTAAQREKLTEVMTAIQNGDRSPFDSQTILRQICNTVKVVEGYTDLPVDDTTMKIAKLKELLHDCINVKNKKVIIFSYFKEVAKIIKFELSKMYSVRVVTGDTKKTCRFSTIQDCYKCEYYKKCACVKKNIFEFVQGDIQILLGTDSLSRAHDLWSADTIINYDLPWNASDMKQRIGRIDRGHKNPAPEYFVYNLVTLGTVEEKIIKKIEQKEKAQGKILPKYNVSLAKLGKTIKVF